MNQRWAFAVGVLAVTILSVVLVMKTPWEVHPVASSDAGAAVDAAGLSDSATAAQDGGGDASEVQPEEAGSLAADAETIVAKTTGPRSVRAGVILVAYAGAEGASSAARSRDAAKALAESLATLAKADFKDAVSKGDSGSFEDIGRIPRGVLERAVEATLFALAVGEVGAVVDTPRGYWIAKRLE